VESAIFLFTRRVLAFFRVNPANVFNQPDFFLSGAPVFDQSSGQPRVSPGKQEGGGGAKKNQKIGEFSFLGILQPTTFHVSISMSLYRFYLHLSISLTAACGSTCEETVLGVKGEPEGKVSRSISIWG